MADRRITHSRKDTRGNITAVGYPGQYWSPRPTADAIRDIESRAHTYFVQWPEKRTEVRVVQGRHGQVLAHRPGLHHPEQPRRPAEPVGDRSGRGATESVSRRGLLGRRRGGPPSQRTNVALGNSGDGLSRAASSPGEQAASIRCGEASRRVRVHRRPTAHLEGRHGHYH